MSSDNLHESNENTDLQGCKRLDIIGFISMN